MILVTGSAGFIGFHVVMKLIKNNNKVIGIDNLNSYYDINLKKARNDQLLKMKSKNFKFYKLDINNNKALTKLFKKYKFKKVIHLAAQAGIRYSLKNPRQYLNSNMIGFFNILDLCKFYKIKHLIYASSSSVYGANTKIPFSENDSSQHPIQFYAATKRSNELMAHAYSHLYKIKTTGLRFFTVYGPWGRPDMSYFIFTKNIISGMPIKVYNNGKMRRDFTYIDDIIMGIKSSIINNSDKLYRIYNLGNSKSEKLMDLISIIENTLQIKADIKYEPLQIGDAIETYADINKSNNELNYFPSISIKDGVPIFIEWYKSFYL